MDGVIMLRTDLDNRVAAFRVSEIAAVVEDSVAWRDGRSVTISTVVLKGSGEKVAVRYTAFDVIEKMKEEEEG